MIKKEHILTAAAAAVSFGVAADAVAAPITYDLVFDQILGDSTGTGFFTIDDSLLIPNTAITDVSDIDAFAATFNDVPGFGTVSFDTDDLDAVLIKVGSDAEIFSVSFGTDGSASTLHLNVDVANIQELKVGTFGAVYHYDIDVTERTAAVPEPGTLALLAAGAAGLPLIRRRRKQRAA